MTFKAGDKIRQLKDCSGAIKGKIYTLKWGNMGGRHLDSLFSWKGKQPDEEGEWGCNCQEKWELAEPLKDIIIHTPTLEEYKQVVQRCLDLGGMWGGGSLNEEYWRVFQDQTCIFFEDKRLSYGSKDYAYLPIITPQQFLLTYWVSPRASEETKVPSEPKKRTKIMSIIKNIFKSTEQKALSHYELTNGDGGLTEIGRAEWIDYLWETMAERKDFIAKIVEEYKKEKKEK